MPSDTVKLSYFLEAIPNLEKVNTIHAFAVVESTRGWQGGGGGLTNLLVPVGFCTEISTERVCIAGTEASDT